MSDSRQFVVRSFPRGVKLTTQMVWTPANDMADAMGGANVIGPQMQAPMRMSWNFTPQSETFDRLGTGFEVQKFVVLPMLFPPRQGEFDAQNLTWTDQATLVELSVGFDQRATQYGVQDNWNGGTGASPEKKLGQGTLTDADMDRYSFNLSLLEKTATCFDSGNGDSKNVTTVLSLDFPGASIFGGEGGFNPYLLDGLSAQLSPYKVYYWRLSCDGLFNGDYDNTTKTAANLAMPSFTLDCTFLFPIGTRDYSQNADDPTDEPYVQNIPAIHLGVRQTKTFHLTPPAADALVTGDDVQNAVTALEGPTLDKLKSGYGDSPGLQADVFPWEQLALDTGMQVVNVQMFPNWWDVRAGDISAANVEWPTGVGFPYTFLGGPYTDPVVHEAFVAVPRGFVIHQVVAGWNTFPYTSQLAAGTDGAHQSSLGTFNQSGSFGMEIGVAAFTGLRSDDQGWQQIAALTVQAADYAERLIDELRLVEGSRAPDAPNMSLFDVPLVWDAERTEGSWFGGGKPFFVGAGDTMTQTRSLAADQPFGHGATGYYPPGTKGGETLLRLRWAMVDQVQGLNDPDHPTEVRTGWGGHHIILIGRQSLLDAQDLDHNANPVTGQI